MTHTLDKKVTVTVGIPAHNEVHTIEGVLRAICGQIQKVYVLERVIVFCDGCTDGTDKKVQAFAQEYPIVSLVNDGKRTGKAERLNQLYVMNTSDVVVVCDADTLITDDGVIESIVSCFRDSHVGIVGARDIPFPPKSFFERVVAAHANLWYTIRKDLHEGDSPYNLHGALVGLRREFASQLVIPPHVFADDTFTYFKAIELGFSFHFARNVIVHYRVPDNFHDYYIQSLRYLGTKDVISGEFGSWIEPYRMISLHHKLRATLRAWSNDPLFVSCAILLDLFMKVLLPFRRGSARGSYWQQIRSTKKIMF
jgi:cellulose synthase/poly-beta-1,6-N-acetylglucosamine synthase-like glycosyltransferase